MTRRTFSRKAAATSEGACRSSCVPSVKMWKRAVSPCRARSRGRLQNTMPAPPRHHTFADCTAASLPMVASHPQHVLLCNDRHLLLMDDNHCMDTPSQSAFIDGAPAHR